MNLGSYSFFYKYTDSGNELAFQVPMVELEPQETIVLWFNVGKLALEDFNQNFGANLSEDEVVAFTDVFPGFANGGNRALVVKISKDRTSYLLVILVRKTIIMEME